MGQSPEQLIRSDAYGSIAAVTLPQDEPIADISRWFTEHGFDLGTHVEPPVRPDQRTARTEVGDPPAFTH